MKGLYGYVKEVSLSLCSRMNHQTLIKSRGETGPKLSFEITLNWKRDKGRQEGQVSDHCNGSDNRKRVRRGG